MAGGFKVADLIIHYNQIDALSPPTFIYSGDIGATPEINLFASYLAGQFIYCGRTAVNQDFEFELNCHHII